MDDDIKNAVRAVLRSGYLRAVLHGTGKFAAQLSPETKDEILRAHRASIESDAKAIDTLLRHVEERTQSKLRAALHAAPGVDHEMLDQAIEYGLAPRGGWRPQ